MMGKHEAATTAACVSMALRATIEDERRSLSDEEYAAIHLLAFSSLLHQTELHRAVNISVLVLSPSALVSSARI